MPQPPAAEATLFGPIVVSTSIFSSFISQAKRPLHPKNQPSQTRAHHKSANTGIVQRSILIVSNTREYLAHTKKNLAIFNHIVTIP
jgi:hypothetical protein